MDYKTKFIQNLCSINTETYEEVVQLVLNDKVFFRNVQNLRKPSLEAFVYFLLMKQRGKIPCALLAFGLQDLIAIIHENNLRLQSESEAFGWVLSAFALMILGERDVDMVRAQVETLVTDIETNLNELPLYYDVLRTLLFLGKERPELSSIFVKLDGKKMIRMLSSESNIMKMKALACLQTMMEFNPSLFDDWLLMLQDGKLNVEDRTFMLHQLMETLLRLEDKKAEILWTLQCNKVWQIVIESLASKVAVCRKEALAILQYSIGYAKQCGQELHGEYFKWSQDNVQSQQLTNSWQSFVTIAEALHETQTHLILPALALMEKVTHLHDAWKHLLLRLILLHENPRVVNFGIQYFLKLRSFDPNEMVLENQFIETFNRTTLFDKIEEIISDLKQYYREPEALACLLQAIPLIGWHSVSYYCIVNVVHDLVSVLKPNEAEGIISLKSLTNCVKVCHNIKNVSLRYITIVLLVKTITRYVNGLQKSSETHQLLAVMNEIEKLSPVFDLSLQQFQDESGTMFCDAITEEALLAHLPNVQVTDTFFIKDILLRRITTAKPAERKQLLRTVSQSNLPVYFNVVYQSPENLQRYYSKQISVVTATEASKIAKAILSNTPLTPSLFAILQAIAKFDVPHSTICGDGWHNIVSDLNRILSDRFMSVDYAETVIVETIQIAYFLACDWGDVKIAEIFFHLVSLEELNETFRRYQSTTPSIDQVYAMISEIYSLHCALPVASNGPRFATENGWTKLISLLDVGNVDVLEKVINILQTGWANEKACDDGRLVVIDRCYKEILNYRKSDHFMKLIKKFIVMLLAPYTASDYGEINPQVTDYITMFLDQASTIYGLANIVYKNVFKIPIPILLNWPTIGKLLLHGIIFGDVQKRDQKIENEVIDHCDLDISFKQHPRYYSQADARVRVLCILFLYRIVEANHPDAVLFLLKLERMLIERFTQITKAKERYYADSITHRQKLRIVQALCVVLKLTGTKPYPLLDVMLYETNQPNINYLIELIVADSSIDTLTIANSLRNEKVKVSGIQSVFVILWLRCCHTNSLDEQYIYLLLPWTMAQNFSTRLYAQITITKLIVKFSPHPVETGPFKEIYAAVNSYLRQGNVERSIEKCMKDFRFNSVFDYGNLLTMENIFHNIPKVSGAPSEDVVGTVTLKECLKALGLGDSNLGQALEFEDLQSAKRENLFLAQSVGGADFVQRKIVPLKSLEPSQELLLGLPENVCLKKMDSTDGLIVVASLVTRAPNLGGLARTSEIFAVKQFIINSLQDIDNKEFQALSMTAEKWLNVGELKAHKIVEYLEEMKSKGYSIVGAEQTTGSKPIQQLQFPKKSILVLGHEKNGLPAEIIRHLDLIGEIPQFGVVRSLNVHVTGAIFMWEYAKQHHVVKSVT